MTRSSRYIIQYSSLFNHLVNMLSDSTGLSVGTCATSIIGNSTWSKFAYEMPSSIDRQKRQSTIILNPPCGRIPFTIHIPLAPFLFMKLWRIFPGKCLNHPFDSHPITDVVVRPDIEENVYATIQ